MSDGKTDAKYKNEIKRDTKNGANVSAKLNTGSASQQKTCTCEKLMEKSEAAKNKLMDGVQRTLSEEKKKFALILMKYKKTDRSSGLGPDMGSPWLQQRQIVRNLQDLESELQSAAPHTFLKGEEAAKLYNCEAIVSKVEQSVDRLNTISELTKSFKDSDFRGKKKALKQLQYDYDRELKFLKENKAAYCSVISVSGAEVAAMMYDGRSAAEAIAIGFIPYVGSADAVAETGVKWAVGRGGDAILSSIGIVPVLGKPIGKGIKALSKIGKATMSSTRAGTAMKKAGDWILGKKKPPNTNPSEGKPTTPKLEEGDSKVGGTKSGVAKVCKKCG